MIRVNIYNTGRVPFITVPCPVKDYPVSDGIYKLLKRTPGIDMEPTKLAIQREIEEAKQKAAANSKSVQPAMPSIPVEKKVSELVPDEPVETPSRPESPYAPLDKSKLANIKDFEAQRLQEIMSGSNTPLVEDFLDEPEETDLPENVELVEDTNPEDEIDAAIEAMEFSDEETNFEVKIPADEVKMKKYTSRSLDGKTKAEMKEILKSRGFNDGPFCPRYHDTVEKLKKKILDSQKEIN